MTPRQFRGALIVILFLTLVACVLATQAFLVPLAVAYG